MSPQQFSLRWNNHTKNLVQVFADQFEREQHVDVTISCQGRFLKAHKIVLGACSPYFQDLFDAHETASHPIIIMNGYSFDDIRSIVEFMYRGEIMVADTAMQRLLAAAEDLQIKGLSNVRSKRDSPQHHPNQQQHHQQSGYGSEGEEEFGEIMNGNIENGGAMGSPQGSCRSDGSGGLSNNNNNVQQHQMMMRSRSNSNNFTPAPNATSASENNGGGKPFVKKNRKRTRTFSYDTNTEMKRKLRIHNKYSQQTQPQNDQQDQEDTPEDCSTAAEDHQNHNSDSHSRDQSAANSPTDSNKEGELNMTINIEPPSMLDIESIGNTDSPLKNGNNSGNGNSSNGNNGVAKAVVMEVSGPGGEMREKIPRPPNSFMIFANEWRRQLASQFPNESNKEISVRLGVMWKNLTEDVKAKYFNAARRANDDHKKKYPDYHYNPKEARMRKMWKLQQQSIGLGHMVTTASHP